MFMNSFKGSQSFYVTVAVLCSREHREPKKITPRKADCLFAAGQLELNF